MSRVAGHGLGTRLRELAAVFLKLGTIGFGGPTAHIALMEDEVVRRRGWLSREEFLDLLAATYLLPGPNSTEMAIHVGRRRAGGAGLLIAGVCFIMPAALIVGAMAWAYVRFGASPPAGAALAAIQPVVIAIVVQALWGLARTALRGWWSRVLALVALVTSLLGIPELTVLVIAGGLAAFAHALRRAAGGATTAAGVLPTWAATVAAGTAPAAFGLWPMFVVFVKIGAVLYGSGYVLVAFLRTDLVHRLGWLTEKQLLDAVAVGQVTPGPVFTTATFVGYVLGGVPGAVAATVGIFLPAFVFVAASGSLIPRLRRSLLAGAILDGIVAASLAVMASAALGLARAAIVDGKTAALGLAAAALLLGTRVNPAWLVLGAGLLGMLWKGFG